MRIVGRQIAAFRAEQEDVRSAEVESVNNLTVESQTVRPVSSKKEAQKAKAEDRPTPVPNPDENEAKLTPKEVTIGRICCESMLLEAEGWIQMLRQGGSDLFMHSDRPVLQSKVQNFV